MTVFVEQDAHSGLPYYKNGAPFHRMIAQSEQGLHDAAAAVNVSRDHHHVVFGVSMYELSPVEAAQAITNGAKPMSRGQFHRTFMVIRG